MLLKVFLVEDETVIREGLRDRIPWDQFGYRFVGEAADGEMALPLIRKTRPDVLITDIKMPFMDGISLSKIVSKEFPRMKIIIVSGYDDFEYARQAIEVGVDQYLLKPVTRMKLKTVLLELKDKIEQDQEQEDYRTQFQNEIQEYEQFSRRRFMEKILEGELSVKEIYDEADSQSIEITAAGYNLLFLYLQEKNKDKMEGFLKKQDEVLHYFLRYPQYLLFRWNVNSYGVLVKGEMSQLEELKTSRKAESAFPVLSECEPLFCIPLYGARAACSYGKDFGELCKLTGREPAGWSRFFSAESGSHKGFPYQGNQLRNPGFCPGVFKRYEQSSGIQNVPGLRSASHSLYDYHVSGISWRCQGRICGPD